MPDIIETLLERVEKPARYTGGEMNAEVKSLDSVDVSFAFCFPDVYEVAMSHLGMKILYGIINELPYASCERFCMPWVDMLLGMREKNVPLFSLESRAPLSRFDIAGFTLQYEMSYANILEMLALGGVPVKSAERGEDSPIVVAGGPCAYNPEPLAPFIDAFMIGDGEDVIVELVDTVRSLKAQNAPRSRIIESLSKLSGVYVPSLYDVSYNADGTIAAAVPRGGAPEKVKKRVVKDLDAAYYPLKIPVPYTQIVHDRIMLEIMRGCTRGCRFCQAGMLYRPVRERSAGRLMDIARALVKATGYEEISLSSLSSGDYSALAPLCESLMAELSEKRVALSLPSLRLDSVVKPSLGETAKVKKTSLTFAPEAGTQRLRDVINKGVTESDLMSAMKDAFEGGWSAVKLYFMLGLPTETMEDVKGIAALAREAVSAYYAVPKAQRAKGLRITCSASVFVPKPFTPFQWCAQDALETVREKQSELRRLLSPMRSVNFNWHDPEVSMLEACFALGDRRLGDVLYTAWQKGCLLDGWSEHFKYDMWMEAFADCDIDPAFYANRARGLDEVLPWDIIDAGVSKEYLKREHKKAMEGLTTRDCRQGCNACGLEGEYCAVCG